MIRLKLLKLRSFRSFVDETTIEFPEKGLVLLQGRNGSGKSTLALAIAYAFDFCPYPATALQSWGSDIPMQIELVFEVDGKTVHLCRGAKTSLTVDGIKASKSKAAVDEQLRQLVGLDPEWLAALTYRQQQARGTFLSMTDKEKKEALSTLLRLDEIERRADEVKKSLPRLEAQADAARKQLADIDFAIAAIPPPPIIDPFVPAAIDAMEREMANSAKLRDTLEKVIANQGAKVASLEGELNYKKATVIGELKNFKVAQGTENSAEAIELSGLLTRARQKLDSLRSQSDANFAAWVKNDEFFRRTKPELEAKAKHLKTNRCPTCSQWWENAKAQLDLVEANLVDLETFMARHPAQFEQDPTIAIVENTIRKIIKKQLTLESHQKLSVAERQLELEKSLETAQEAVAAARKELANHKDTLSQMFREEILKIGELDQLRTQYAADKRAIERNTETRERFQADAEKARSEFAAYTNTLNQEQDFLALIGREGFLGAIFDEVLAEISDEANKVLLGLPNTSDVTIEFRSENTTAKGTVTREIKPYVTIRGHAVPLRAGCSGGMYLSVEQAVDLALNRVVTRRTGVVPGWIILDECFADQDLPTKEEAMGVLREFARDRLVLVVDHATEMKEAFTQRISMECQEGVSKVVPS